MKFSQKIGKQIQNRQEKEYGEKKLNQEKVQLYKLLDRKKEKKNSLVL